MAFDKVTSRSFSKEGLVNFDRIFGKKEHAQLPLPLQEEPPQIDVGTWPGWMRAPTTRISPPPQDEPSSAGIADDAELRAIAEREKAEREDREWREDDAILRRGGVEF